MYKLIAIDLDGTLKNENNEITPKTKQALLDIQKKGIKIVLASGRPTCGLRHEAKELELDKYGGYILSYNGASVINAKTKEVLYEKVVSAKQAKAAYQHAKAFDVNCLLYEENMILTENSQDEYVHVEARINDIDKKEVESLLTYLEKPVYKLLLTGKPDYLATIEEDYKKPFGDTLSIYKSAPFFLEVMAQGIDKAATLDVLASSLGITSSEVMAFGDGYNDISMIDYAGMGIAMANAVESVKEKANMITKSHNEDGIAYALAQILGQDNVAN